MSRVLFGLLLRLYPTSFRNEYGAEMRADFTANGGRVGPGLVVDTLWNAAAAHFDILRQDLNWSMRSLGRTPGFAAAVIGVAAVGVGSTVAVFTLADHVLIRPLPFRDPDRLVKVWESTPSHPRLEVSPANYRDWMAAGPPLEEAAASRGVQINVAGDGEPRVMDGAAMTANMLPMLGVQPLIGRSFTAEDDRTDAPLTVLLSFTEWRDRYASDPSVIGRKLRLDDRPAEIIGVMPQWFLYPGRRANFWVPMRFAPSDFQDRTNTFLLIVGRLRPGTSVEVANAQMTAIAARLQQQYPAENAKVSARVLRLKDEIPQQSRMLLYALSGAAAGLLLIACTNLANLLLARAAQRRRELAIRASLGAGRERLTRQLLTESLVLACAGGLGGASLAVFLLPLLARLVPTSLPLPATPAPDAHLWGICLAVTLLTGIGFGLFPALLASRDLGGTLRESGRAGGLGSRSGRVRSTLVIAEIAACAVLLTGSGLLLRALWKLHSTDLGFRTENRLTVRTSLPMPKYESVSRRQAFYSRVLSETAALPGVKAAAYTSFLPVAMGGGLFPVQLPGQPPDGSLTRSSPLRFVTPDFFRAMGIPLLQGRTLAPTDSQNSLRVAVVSESFVQNYLNGAPALGSTFDFGFEKRTIVGVVGNIRNRGFERASEPQVYLPYLQVRDGYLPWFAPKDLIVHTDDLPGTLAAVRHIVASVDPELPVAMAQSMDEVVAADTEGRRTQAYVLGAFTGAAFLLAIIGIHGLLAFAVSQRRQEIGVRLALGAQQNSIVAMILREGLTLGSIGLVLGMLGAVLTGQALVSLLAGVSPFDPVAFGASAALCLLLSAAGSLGPALRAVRVDPATSIRGE